MLTFLIVLLGLASGCAPIINVKGSGKEVISAQSGDTPSGR